MRLWSIHPRYLDRQGLTALWREALLAQKVLAGATKGYRHHPQLTRFRAYPVADGGPRAAMNVYLSAVVQEAQARGYSYDASKVGQWWDGEPQTSTPGSDAPSPLREASALPSLLDVTTGQRDYEWAHLRAKLARRSPDVSQRWATVSSPDLHPLFRLIDGPIAEWEVTG